MILPVAARLQVKMNAAIIFSVKKSLQIQVFNMMAEKVLFLLSCVILAFTTELDHNAVLCAVRIERSMIYAKLEKTKPFLSHFHS